ncbi:MAG: QueT transporter family protein [Erysipelotrichaceae bacterium]|nr:QueT transporter family protein [Erysipelotrichaceae bacterium]
MNSKVKHLVRVSLIAAVYTVVSLLIAPFAYGPVQVRLSEALTVLPLVYQPAVYGVTLGCFLTNLIGAMSGLNPIGWLDCLFGTVATLLAAWFTCKNRDVTVINIPVVSLLMPVLFNMVIVGLELAIAFFPTAFVSGWIISGLEVAAGEIVSVVIGYILVRSMDKKNVFRER